MMEVAAYVYPWDVVGDGGAAEVVASLGLDHAVVAAFYHATRALTPRHPGHRVVVAERSAAYLPVDAEWQRLLPRGQTCVEAEDAFGATAAALAGVGVPTHAWVVVCHVDGFGGVGVSGAFGASRVVNAYGDVYPWALCPSHEAVLEYAVGLAAVTASRADVSGIEFEAAGWYGFDHLHEHDKVAGIPLSDDELYLMSLCFCDACGAEYQASGIDAAELRTLVRERLDTRFAAAEPLVGGLADVALADAVLGMRTRVGDRLRAAMVREVRSRRGPDFPILFHATPRPHRSTAFTGVDPATFSKEATGLVVNCWNGSTENVTLSTGGHPAAVYAGLLGVRGMGAHPERLAEAAAEMRVAGARGIRVYHAGIASSADLEAWRVGIGRVRGS